MRSAVLTVVVTGEFQTPIGVPCQFNDNDTSMSRHPTGFPARARLNSTYTIKGPESGYIRLSPPQVLRPLQEIYHRIDEHLSDNRTQEIVLRYEVGHRGADSVVSLHKSRTQGILQ
jgi:hypothetical protein